MFILLTAKSEETAEYSYGNFWQIFIPFLLKWEITWKWATYCSVLPTLMMHKERPILLLGVFQDGKKQAIFERKKVEKHGVDLSQDFQLKFSIF